jgi:hypothetical protein
MARSSLLIVHFCWARESFLDRNTTGHVALLWTCSSTTAGVWSEVFVLRIACQSGSKFARIGGADVLQFLKGRDLEWVPVPWFSFPSKQGQRFGNHEIVLHEGGRSYQNQETVGVVSCFWVVPTLGLLVVLLGLCLCHISR